MPPQSRYRARPRDRRQAMRSLTSLHESRVYSPENFWSPVQKDFCNNIGTTRTSGNVRLESEKRSKADIEQTSPNDRVRTHVCHSTINFAVMHSTCSRAMVW